MSKIHELKTELTDILVKMRGSSIDEQAELRHMAKGIRTQIKEARQEISEMTASGGVSAFTTSGPGAGGNRFMSSADALVKRKTGDGSGAAVPQPTRRKRRRRRKKDDED